MRDTLNELENLVDLAREPSSEKRRALLRDITDIFLNDPETYSQFQSQCFGDIMSQLSYELETRVREELSKRISSEKHAPAELVRRFAHDEISVARPVLENSPVLTEGDLIEISMTMDQEHLQAITVRPTIGQNLSRALVEHGDDHTVERLLRNENAQIALDTAEKIVDRAKYSERLQVPLIDRNDISGEVVQRLYDYVADELKTRILETEKSIDREVTVTVVNTVANDLAQEQASSVEDYIEALSRKGRLTETALIRFTKEQRPLEFLLSLAKIVEIDINSARRVIEDKTGKSLLIVCKSKDMSPATFKELAMSPMTAIRPKPAEILSLIRIYSKFEEEQAQRVIRFWKTRKHAVEKDENAIGAAT